MNKFDYEGWIYGGGGSGKGGAYDISAVYNDDGSQDITITGVTTVAKQDKTVSITKNGDYLINADEGYDCLSSVTANVNVQSVTPVEHLTFAEAYELYRPSDWMKLPTIDMMEDNTAYFLAYAPSDQDSIQGKVRLIRNSATKGGAYVQAGTTDEQGNWTGFGDVYEQSSGSSYVECKVNRSDIPAAAISGNVSQIVFKCWGPNFDFFAYQHTSSPSYPASILDLKIKSSTGVRLYSMGVGSGVFAELAFIDVHGGYNMFKNDCHSFFDGQSALKAIHYDLAGYNELPNTTTSMFSECSSLKVIEGNLFSNHMQSVTELSSMFNGCSSLAAVPDMNLPSTLDYVAGLFRGCSSLKEVPSMDITVTSDNLGGIFEGCSGITDLSNFRIHDCTAGLQSIFKGCTSLKRLPVFSNVTVTKSVAEAFMDCISLDVPLSLNSGSNYITSLANAFCNCYKVPSITINGSLGKVTNIDYAFYNCHVAVVTADLGSLGTISACDRGRDFFIGADRLYHDRGGDFSDIKAGFLSSLLYAGVPYLSVRTGTTTSISGSYVYTRFLNVKFDNAITRFNTTANQLRSLTFDFSEYTESAGFDITISNAALTRSMIVNMLRALPVITGNKTFRLSYVIYDEPLTDDDKAIATDKGWTLAL